MTNGDSVLRGFERVRQYRYAYQAPIGHDSPYVRLAALGGRRNRRGIAAAGAESPKCGHAITAIKIILHRVSDTGENYEEGFKRNRCHAPSAVLGAG